MHKRLSLTGLVIWAIATAVLRLVGQHLLRPMPWTGTLLLFTVSFLLMGSLARGLCEKFRLAKEDWLRGAFSLALPTLLLDPFSSAYFPLVFPNMAPQVAGVFGGWMLICCAGAFVGASLGPRKSK